MADTFKGIITADGKKRQLPYDAVLGKPVSDTTFSEEGGFADSKAVGDKFAKVDSEIASLKEDISNKITKFYASNQGENHLADSDNGKIQDMIVYGKSSQDGTPSPENPVEIKSVVNPTVKVTNDDGLKVRFVTLNNIALNAIPVKSGGNVTINGQQYVADYVDVKRGKLVRMVGVADQDTFATTEWSDTGAIVIFSQIPNVSNEIAIVTISSKFVSNWAAGDEIHHFTQTIGQTLVIVLPKTITTVEQGEEIRAKGFKFYYILKTPIETDLTTEEIASFKALTTYYPTTNISVNSEQLDGYTVFNYPISIQNGWNYVKQQLNDNRNYIYDMDLQSAEAYVNSEYAVALTELEV